MEIELTKKFTASHKSCRSKVRGKISINFFACRCVIQFVICLHVQKMPSRHGGNYAPNANFLPCSLLMEKKVKSFQFSTSINFCVCMKASSDCCGISWACAFSLALFQAPPDWNFFNTTRVHSRWEKYYCSFFYILIASKKYGGEKSLINLKF